MPKAKLDEEGKTVRQVRAELKAQWRCLVDDCPEPVGPGSSKLCIAHLDDYTHRRPMVPLNVVEHGYWIQSRCLPLSPLGTFSQKEVLNVLVSALVEDGAEWEQLSMSCGNEQCVNYLHIDVEESNLKEKNS